MQCKSATPNAERISNTPHTNDVFTLLMHVLCGMAVEVRVRNVGVEFVFIFNLFFILHIQTAQKDNYNNPPFMWYLIKANTESFTQEKLGSF